MYTGLLLDLTTYNCMPIDVLWFNSRYYALRPLYEECKEKVLRLEKLNEELKNSSCQDHCAKIIDLEKGNDDLNKEKNALISELTILRTSSLNIESITNKYDKLKTDFEELKSKHEKLQVDIINGKEEVTLLKETKCSVNQTVQTEELTIKQDNFINETHKTCSDKIIQTEFLTNSVSDKNVETEISTDSRGQNTDGVDEHDHSCSFREESTRLSAQVEAHVEKLKQLEEQQSCEKNLYVQLYNKGFQAAKLENSQVSHDPGGYFRTSRVFANGETQKIYGDFTDREKSGNYT